MQAWNLFALLQLSSPIAANVNNFREFRIVTSDWSKKTKEVFPAVSEGGCVIACFRTPECMVSRFHERTCFNVRNLHTREELALPVVGIQAETVTALVRREDYDHGISLVAHS